MTNDEPHTHTHTTDAVFSTSALTLFVRLSADTELLPCRF